MQPASTSTGAIPIGANASKAALAAGILSEDARAVEKFSAEDLDALLAPIPDA